MCLSIEVAHPDSVLSKGVHVGFEWIVVHNYRQFRCGYIRVPKGHPWHEQGDIDADVHGGITFSDADTPCNKGGRDDGWWISFDTMHLFDAPDSSLPSNDAFKSDLLADCFSGGTTRSQEYVEAECRRLCEQAAAKT